jgi:hypothetical protein
MSTFSKLAHYIWSKRLHIVGVCLSQEKRQSPRTHHAHRLAQPTGWHSPQTTDAVAGCVLCAVCCAVAVGLCLCSICALCCVLCAVCCVLDAAGRADLLLGSAGQTDLARTPSLQYEALARPLHGRRGRCRAAHPPQGTEHERSASPHPASRARAPPFVLRSHAESSS